MDRIHSLLWQFEQMPETSDIIYRMWRISLLCGFVSGTHCETRAFALIAWCRIPSICFSSFLAFIKQHAQYIMHKMSSFPFIQSRFWVQITYMTHCSSAPVAFIKCNESQKYIKICIWNVHVVICRARLGEHLYCNCSCSCYCVEVSEKQTDRSATDGRHSSSVSDALTVDRWVLERCCCYSWWWWTGG